MSQKKVFVFNETLLKLFLLMGVFFISSQSFSGPLNTKLFLWDEWIEVKSGSDMECSKNIGIKFSASELYQKDKTLTVYTKGIDEQIQSESSEPEKQQSEPDPCTYKFSRLPVIECGEYTDAGKACPELPPIFALGYGLLFSLKPELTSGGECASMVDSCSCFVKESSLDIETSQAEIIFTISKNGKEGSVERGAAPEKIQTKIVITIKQSQLNGELADAVYSLVYPAGGRQAEACYTVEGAANTLAAPFLKYQVVERSEELFEFFDVEDEDWDD
ncbi:hypothetical protein [Spongorhabdus nitratireducens]